MIFPLQFDLELESQSDRHKFDFGTHENARMYYI